MTDENRGMYKHNIIEMLRNNSDKTIDLLFNREDFITLNENKEITDKHGHPYTMKQISHHLREYLKHFVGITDEIYVSYRQRDQETIYIMDEETYHKSGLKEELDNMRTKLGYIETKNTNREISELNKEHCINCNEDINENITFRYEPICRKCYKELSKCHPWSIKEESIINKELDIVGISEVMKDEYLPSDTT